MAVRISIANYVGDWLGAAMSVDVSSEATVLQTIGFLINLESNSIPDENNSPIYTWSATNCPTSSPL